VLSHFIILSVILKILSGAQSFYDFIYHSLVSHFTTMLNYFTKLPSFYDFIYHSLVSHFTTMLNYFTKLPNHSQVSVSHSLK
jgi:hypothetical protein